MASNAKTGKAKGWFLYLNLRVREIRFMGQPSAEEAFRQALLDLYSASREIPPQALREAVQDVVEDLVDAGYDMSPKGGKNDRFW